jgi:hypothetical protein
VASADRDAERYRSVAQRLYEIAKPIRVLAALRWPASVREEFLAGGADALPDVDYPPFDEQPIVDAVRDVRRSIYPGGLVDDWLDSVAESLELTARMLAARGTEAFLVYNRDLYGTPHTPLRYDPITPTSSPSACARSWPGSIASACRSTYAATTRRRRWPTSCPPG